MENFVTYKLAVKLKEKGFEEECLCHYIGEDLFYNIESPIANKQLWFCHNKYNNIWHRDNYDAPTISQVLKWLRKEKKIHICIDIYDDGWFFDIASFYKEDTGVYEIKLPYKSSNVTPDYDSYEQAALAGIKYVLDNLI